MKLWRAFALSLLVSAPLCAQNAALMPVPKPQFLDANGYPLAGGLVYTCAAGSTCPGSPLTTYTDATASTPNPNPVVLDAGGFANIWLGASTYKIVVETSVGVIVTSTDNVQSTGVLALVKNPIGNAAQSVNGPLNSCVQNGMYVAGSACYATIGAAITAAGLTGSVLIPPSYSGTDTYTNPNSILITDQRPALADTTKLQMQDVLPLMTESGFGDTSQAQNCAAVGTCSVVYWGDSITNGMFAVANEDSWAYQVSRALKRSIPGVTFNQVDLAIGGTGIENAADATYVCGTQWNQTGYGNGYLTWPFPCTAGVSWQQHVAQQIPDIVFIGFGMNDSFIQAQNFIAYLGQVIAFLNSLPRHPTIVLVATYPNSIYNGATYGSQPTLLSIGQATREYARQKGLLLVDAGRLFTLFRDGYDPARDHFNYEPQWLNYPAGWLQVSGAAPGRRTCSAAQ